MEFKELKLSERRFYSAGIDLKYGHHYLCILTGMAYTPEYHPITEEEFHHFEQMEHEELLKLTNRCITEMANGDYKFQWASKWNALHAIVRKSDEENWMFTMKDDNNNELGPYQWDKLIINVYKALETTQQL